MSSVPQDFSELLDQSDNQLSFSLNGGSGEKNYKDIDKKLLDDLCDDDPQDIKFNFFVLSKNIITQILLVVVKKNLNSIK